MPRSAIATKILSGHYARLYDVAYTKFVTAFYADLLTHVGKTGHEHGELFCDLVWEQYNSTYQDDLFMLVRRAEDISKLMAQVSPQASSVP